MDFKIKIDLSSQSIINDQPAKEKKKKKKERANTDKHDISKSNKKSKKGEKADKVDKVEEENKSDVGNSNPNTDVKKKKKHSNKKMTKKLNEAELDKTPKAINSNSIISLTLLNNDNFKGDQAQKLSMINKKKPRHWEKRWVLVPNVFEFTKEIWLKKWVLVDGGEDIADNNNYLQQYYSSYIKPFKDVAPKKYQCSFDECGKIFFDSSSLRKHLLTHGERHYICKHEGCGKKFLDNSKLRRHQLVHTGEKPFKCELCQKKFSLDFNLKTHLRTHTGEKPYICSFPGCDKRFTQSSNLTAHEKTHKEQAAGKTEGSGNGNGQTLQNLPTGTNSTSKANLNGKTAIFSSIKQEDKTDRDNSINDSGNNSMI